MLCHVGLSKDRPDSAPRERTFCQFALNSTDPILVEDCSKDDRFKNHPVVTGDPYVKVYGGFPLGTFLFLTCSSRYKKDFLQVLIKIISSIGA